jgi:transketolase
MNLLKKIKSNIMKKDLKLNPNIFEEDVEKKPIRDGFGTGLVKAGENNDNVVALTADLSESVRTHWFAEKFPNRFFQVGIAEQNLVSVASGMAAMGKIPFAASYAMFSPGRSWEQIRTTIAYNNQPVIVVGSHAGVTTGPDGGTHQALEDIAITRVIPNMTVISPCDHIEAEKAIVALAKKPRPAYIRLGREKTPVITTTETPFEIGQNQIFYAPENGKIDVGIIATGFLVHTAIRVAKEFADRGIDVAVMNVATIKPMDEKSVIDFAKKSGAIVTVEEHQIAGGLGGVVSELLAKNRPTPVEFVGINDRFGESGEPMELINYFDLDENGITEAVEKVLSRK